MARLILASASPRRLDLLKQIGYVPHITHPANVDETPLSKEKPKVYSQRIAYNKALTVSKVYPQDVVLAADTIVCVGTRILGKPVDNKQARKFLNLLSGRKHRVYTAIVLIHQGQVRKKTALTFVKFKRLNSEEIEFHTASNEWQDKSGGYMIQGLASAYIESINGSVSNVVGLPLYETNNALRSFGLKPSFT